MFKKLLLILLVLTTLQVPIGTLASSTVSTTYAEIPSTVNIETMLNLEFAMHRTSVSLADDSGVSAILRFDNELTKAEISFAETLGVDFKRRGDDVVHVGAVYIASVADSSSLQILGSLDLIHASSGSKQFFPALPSSVPSIDVPDVWNNFELDNQAIDGTGTRVAVIDTGAAWLHPSFWRSSTDALTVLPNGPDYYADIDGDAIADSNEGPINSVEGQTGPSFDYNQDYMFIDIDDNGLFEYAEGDRWLGGIDDNNDGFISLNSENVVLLGESKIAVFYDQHNNNVYIRGVNLTDALAVGDTNGHGTHVASTIAGGQPGMTSYVGVAPGADLIIIRSPLDSSSVIDGIAFAIENDADVINMSFSSYLGFLDGTDIEDIAISEAMMKNGTISTLAAGNLGGRPKHAFFEVPSGGEGSAILSVVNPPDYSFLSLLWHSTDNDEHVILSPPGGEDIDLGSFNEIAGTPQLLETSNISAYVFPDISPKGMNRLIIQVSDDSHNWDSGSWTVSVTNPSGADISVDGYAWDNSWTGMSMRFTSNVDYTRTISSPGTADLGVTVASYNEVTERISPSSSVGPRIDGIPKPTIAAPGDAIRAAFKSVSNLWISRSGTSMAAPHAAGVVALIRQAAGEDNGWKTLSALYQGAGGQDAHYSPASSSWGYGLCNPVWSVQHLLTLEDGPIYWDGIPEIETDSEDLSIYPELDITGVKVYLSHGNTRFEISMRDLVNYNSSDELILDWDTDSSMTTGLLGIDRRVVLTEGEALLFTWTGSVFSPDGSAVWYNESSAVYLSIDHDVSTTHGRFQVSTSNSTHNDLDSTNTIVMENQWRPLIESLALTAEETLFNLQITISDKDTDISLLETEISIIDGGLSVIESDTHIGQYTIGESYDISNSGTSYIVSMLIAISDSYSDFIIPPLMLSGGVALELRFSEVTLDQETVRVGPLFSERITGKVVLEGFLLAEAVRLSFQSSRGLEYNLTLNGSQGVFLFDVAASGLAIDSYDVYAVAISEIGGEISQLAGTVSIVQDYSIGILIGGIGIGILALVVLGRRYQAR